MHKQDYYLLNEYVGRLGDKWTVTEFFWLINDRVAANRFIISHFICIDPIRVDATNVSFTFNHSNISHFQIGFPLQSRRVRIGRA